MGEIVEEGMHAGTYKFGVIDGDIAEYYPVNEDGTPDEDASPANYIVSLKKYERLGKPEYIKVTENITAEVIADPNQAKFPSSQSEHSE